MLQALLRVLCASALSLCAGCLWVPDRGVECGISTTSRAALVPGQATRADVLCELGAPDWACPDGTHLVYSTHVTKSILIIYFVLYGELREWGHFENLWFEFDENGVLRKKSQSTDSFSFARTPEPGDLDDSPCEELFRVWRDNGRREAFPELRIASAGDEHVRLRAEASEEWLTVMLRIAKGWHAFAPGSKEGKPVEIAIAAGSAFEAKREPHFWDVEDGLLIGYVEIDLILKRVAPGGALNVDFTYTIRDAKGSESSRTVRLTR